MSAKNARLKRKCKKKIRYGSKPKAVKSMILMQKKQGLPAGALKTYKCPYCHGHHIATANRRVLINTKIQQCLQSSQ
jgi:hypothetical protein